MTDTSYGPERTDTTSSERDQPEFDEADLDDDALPDYAPDYDNGELDDEALPDHAPDYDNGELDDDTLPDYADGSDGVQAKKGDASAAADDPAPNPNDEPRKPAGGEKPGDLPSDPGDEVDPERAAAIDGARAEVARGYDIGEARAEVDAAYAQADDQGMAANSSGSFSAAAEAASDELAAGPATSNEVEFVSPEPPKEVEFAPPEPASDASGAAETQDEQIPAESAADQWAAKFSADKTASVDLVDLPEIYQETKETIDNARQGVDRWDATDKARADKWLGDSSEETRQYLDQVLTNIDRNLDQATLRPLEPAEDKPEIFAYVYGTEPGRDIYVGEAFWQAGSNPPDTQAGVLVHEMSHFEDIGGTIDDPDAYGAENSERLARTEPEKAARAADNFEYFVEEYQKGPS